MNAESKSPFLAFCGILGAIALGAVVVNSVHTASVLPPLDQARGEERKSSRLELVEKAQAQMGGYALLQKENGIWQVPIELAMEIVSTEWKNASSGREKLMKRAEKAFKTAEPPAAALSEFE